MSATRTAAGIVLLVLAFLMLLALSLPSATASGDAGFDVGNADPQLVVLLASDFDLVARRLAIPLEIFVHDLNGVPQADVPVSLTASTGRVVPDRVVTDSTGWAAATYVADVAGDETVQITARSDLAGSAQGIDEIRVRVVALPPPPIYAESDLLSAGLLSTLVAFFWSEPGRTSFASLCFPLYTRLKREHVLDHFVRGQIFGAVRTRPCIAFAELRRLLGLSNGNLSYHLRILEIQGFLASYREGIHRRYVPAGMPAASESGGAGISELQRRLLETLQAEPETTQRDLAAKVGVTQQCVSYNLLFLRRQGSVDRVREGRRTRYVLAP